MKVEMIKGVEGYSIYFNDVRILGPKPWGGGTIVKRWTLSVEHAERLRDLLDEFIKSTGGTQ